jgi:hypothetical protein
VVFREASAKKCPTRRDCLESIWLFKLTRFLITFW